MKTDIIISNPPFDIGSYIVRAMIDYCMDEDTEAMVIGPLNIYKSKGNYKHVAERYPLENLFDADITKNLSLVRLFKTADESKTYKDLEMASYDPKFKAFYEVNIELPSPWVKYSHAGGRKEDESLDNTTLVLNRRTAGDGVVLKKTEYSDWNDGLLSDSSVFIESTRPHQWRADIFWMKSNKSRNNVWTWYRVKGKYSLAHKVILGMNKVDGSVEDAFPKIDWEAISDHPLWKGGDYDGAVLDVMRLKWNENKDGVIYSTK